MLGWDGGTVGRHLSLDAFFFWDTAWEHRTGGFKEKPSYCNGLKHVETQKLF